MRICFLLNHYATHQVAHAAPFAFELSRRDPKAEVTIACTSDAQLEAAQRLAAHFPGQRAKLERLQMSPRYRVFDAAFSRFWFAAKRGMLSSNREFFRQFDAIAAPEKHFVALRTRYGVSRAKLIHTRHGAGDREGGFDERTRDVDLTLVSGRKIYQRLVSGGLADADELAIVGYPKLDLADASPRPARLFANDRPTVLYNPHFDSQVGSWREQGIAVLEWFAAQPGYNLMFAPHVVLFERPWRHAARVPKRLLRAPNLRFDPGSSASTDMTYTRAADIYLGDVSSQVYEFIAEPRPCVFLNVHGVAWQSNPHYAHWRFGPVIERVEQIGEALAAAQRERTTYETAQREALAVTFSRDPERTAAQRGADAISEFMREGRVVSPCYGLEPPSSAR